MTKVTLQAMITNNNKEMIHNNNKINNKTEEIPQTLKLTLIKINSKITTVLTVQDDYYKQICLHLWIGGLRMLLVQLKTRELAVLVMLFQQWELQKVCIKSRKEVLSKISPSNNLLIAHQTWVTAAVTEEI